MNILAYQCPHCGSTVDLPEEKINEVVNCPNPRCGRPFLADVPSAQPLGRSEGGNRTVASSLEDEHVIRVVHPAMRSHPFLLTAAVLLVVGGLIVALLAQVDRALLPADVTGWTATIAGLALTGAGLLWLGVWRLSLHFQTLTITSERTMYEEGFVSRRTSEVRHNDVRNLQVHQTFSQRLLNVGDLAISSAGQEDFEIVLKAIPDPNGVAELIRQRQ
jgi:hypothetical protein